MGLSVYTGATFDLPHSGHVNFLRMCRELAGPNGIVTVSLNTDEFITAYKGKPPVMTYDERKSVISAFRYVDNVVENIGGKDSTLTIEAYRPDLIVIGSDWARRDYYAQMGFTQDWLDERDIGLCYIPYTQGISTTAIKERLRSGR